MNKENLEKLINESKEILAKKEQCIKLSDEDLDKVTGGIEYFNKNEVPLAEYQAKINKIFILRNQYCYVMDVQTIPNSNNNEELAIVLLVDFVNDGINFVFSDEFKDAVEVDINTII